MTSPKAVNMISKAIIAVTLFAGVAYAQSSPAVAQASRGIELLKSEQREPSSFGVEKVFTSGPDKKGIMLTCIEYHGRNGFSGMNRSMATYAEKDGKPLLASVDGLSCNLNPSKKYGPVTEITSELNQEENK